MRLQLSVDGTEVCNAGTSSLWVCLSTTHHYSSGTGMSTISCMDNSIKW